GKTLKLQAADPSVATTQGKALARCGDVPIVVVHHYGQGAAIYLNLEIGAYCYDRLQAGSGTSLPGLVEGMLRIVEIEPRVRVLGEDGKRLPGTEVVIFKNGGCEHVAVFRNPQFDDGGWRDFPTMKAPGWAGSIDNSLLEQEASVTIQWRKELRTYDIRKKQDLGVLRIHKATMGPWEPLVFTRSAQQIPKLNLSVASQAEAGSQCEITLRNASALPGKTCRVVHLELETPASQVCDLYTRNLLMNSQSHVERVPLALNDPKGRWRLRACDLLTGHVEEASFQVI
ncbi:MAG TPA: hypothetical protein VFL79_07605, partial [Terriglobia bacterium]|nr:hypothetical protein [Terriglobia bacterium]